MDIFLFTNYFPYQRAEPFLLTEFAYAVKSSHSLSVLSLYGQNGVVAITTKEIPYKHNYVLTGPLRRSELFRKGVFNLSPALYHILELKRLIKSFSLRRAYQFLTSLLVTRAVISSHAFRQLVNEIKRAEAPVIYFYWGDNLSWTLPYLLQRIGRKDVKVVMRLHRTELYEYLKGGYAPLRRSIFQRTHLICPVSEDGLSWLRGKYPEFAAKMKVHRLGVEDRGTNPPSAGQALVVVSASYVVPVKRVQWIFEALQQSGIPVVWHHFGGGPGLETLRDLLHSKREQFEVRLHGQTANAALMDFYLREHVDVFVNASFSEGLPVSIMEALSFGIPVIAPAVGGIAELVGNDCGILLKPEFNAGDLSAAIKEFASQPNTAKSERRVAAREVFFSKANAAINYPAFYKALSTL
jgi:colanic acid/amylovoran biosynthesis glycosyltransferase